MKWPCPVFHHLELIAPRGALKKQMYQGEPSGKKKSVFFGLWKYVYYLHSWNKKFGVGRGEGSREKHAGLPVSIQTSSGAQRGVKQAMMHVPRTVISESKKIDRTQFLGDDTHAVVTRPSWAKGYTKSVVFCVGGFEVWPIDMCSNKDAGKGEPETPTLCDERGREREAGLSKRQRSRNVARGPRLRVVLAAVMLCKRRSQCAKRVRSASTTGSGHGTCHVKP